MLIKISLQFYSMSIIKNKYWKQQQQKKIVK